MTDFMQFGEGSWSRTIGVQWPFDVSRTVYARWGGLVYSATPMVALRGRMG